MQDTCDSTKCKFFKFLKLEDSSDCVNFMESWWTPSKEDKPILIKDCCQKRLFLMIQDLSNRLVGVQKSQEEARNESVWVQVVAEVIGKNSGVNLEEFVKERQRLQNIEKLKLELKPKPSND